VPDRLGEVAAFGEALKPVVVGHDDEGPVLPVLRAPGPTCCLQDGVQVLTGEGALLVVADRTQREDLLVEVGHVPRLERGQPLGYRMSWVHRNNASVLPVASSSTSTSQSWVVRPPCTIRPSVTIDPSRSVDKKLAFNSTAANPDAPSGRLATQPNPAGVSARRTTAPACMQPFGAGWRGRQPTRIAARPGPNSTISNPIEPGSMSRPDWVRASATVRKCSASIRATKLRVVPSSCRITWGAHDKE